jgi:hypothetical protein
MVSTKQTDIEHENHHIMLNSKLARVFASKSTTRRISTTSTQTPRHHHY